MDAKDTPRKKEALPGAVGQEGDGGGQGQSRGRRDGGRKQLLEIEGNGGVAWKIVKKLGSGSFGDVYLGVQNKKLGEPQEVAIKVEDLKAAHPQLAYEAKLLSLLKGTKGIANLYFSGVCKGYQVMVMDLMSYSLEDVLVLCYGKFTLKTVLLLAEQLLQRIEDVHNSGFIHRDIKPENFLLGRGERKDTVHIIDFGLSKRYCDAKTHEHIPYKDNKSLTGTARYASVNAHRGIEQSRRDDLEAIGHMMFYFLKGNLPWQGLPAKTKDEKYRKIKEKKQDTTIESLAAGCPEEFATYLSYVRSLRFTDKPDYTYLRQLFADRYAEEGYDRQDPVFDWTSKIKDKGAAVISKIKEEDRDKAKRGDDESSSGKKEKKQPTETTVTRKLKEMRPPKSRMTFSRMFGLCSRAPQVEEA